MYKNDAFRHCDLGYSCTYNKEDDDGFGIGGSYAGDGDVEMDGRGIIESDWCYENKLMNGSGVWEGMVVAVSLFGDISTVVIQN